MTTPRQLLISHSSRKLLHSCARKFEFRKLYSHPAKDENLGAALGQALHAGYQHYLIHQDEEAAIWEFMRKYPVHLCSNPMDDRSMEAGYYTLMELVNATPLKQYEIARIKCLDGETRHAIEVPFQIDFSGFSLSDEEPWTVSYTGYIDAILYDYTTDGYTVADIKTTRRKLVDATPLYQFSEQCIPYAMVLDYMQGQAVERFGVLYIQAAVDALSPNVQVYQFDKTQNDVIGWFRGLVMDLVQMKQYITTDFWPRTGGGDGCMAWNKPCQFFDICGIEDKNIIRQIIEDESNRIALDEAVYSKTGREEFVPWVRFEIPVGG